MAKDPTLVDQVVGVTMTRIDKTFACFKELGFAFELERFESRLIAQKLVYLLQELGVELGYRDYNFYMRGTYSPRLTKDLFDEKKNIQKLELDAEDRKKIQRLHETVDLRPHLLEVMAAYRFLRSHGTSEPRSIGIIKNTKPFLSDRDIAIGVSKCKGIFPETSPQDFNALQEEMGPWDDAAAEDEL